MKKSAPSFMFTLLIVCATLFFCCDKEDLPTTTQDENELVFFNGNIYTVDEDLPHATAIYVQNGIIRYVGTEEEARNTAPEDAVFIDLEGAFMMPGLHDVHLHPLEAATDNFHFIVEDDIEDPEDYAYAIEDALDENPENGWLLGWGHWIDVPLAATRSPKLIIDDVAPDRPVAIMEQTSHSVWCNSKALELLGITDDTPDPQGGIIMREANGEANGILIDNAGNLLLDLALTPTAASAQNDYNGLIDYALPELAKNGLTSICDARTYWKRDHHTTWQRIADEGKLTARVNLGLWAYPTEDDDSQIQALKELYDANGDDLLKVNQIKIYADGIIHNTTAAMQEDYHIDYFDLPTNNGLNYFTEQRIAAYLTALEGTGFDFHIHALGNRGVHEALNAIEQSGSATGRHRLTHVEYVQPIDYSRFAQLNVTADAQVVGDFTQPGHWHDNDYLIGSDLNDRNIPIKDLSTAGARLTLSSDWDVSDLNPFIGIQNAVTRIPQHISLEEAIKAYTINAAYVMRQENTVGSITVGKSADLVVLDRDILAIPVGEIGQTMVLETYLQGRLIYER